MSAVHLTELRRTDSQILGVSFDTSFIIYAINIHSSQLREIFSIQTQCITEFFRNFGEEFHDLNYFDNNAIKHAFQS